ncbi:Fc.00g040580.m01.CDS01 [Cosmosporella sp. VM-42]
MPEIAEVARIVHFLRLHIVGKRITSASAIDDKNVFGKVGTSGAEVEETLIGKKIVSAGSQGKYFWITLEKPPHIVMHFGMSGKPPGQLPCNFSHKQGWMHIKGEKTAYTNYYNKMKKGDLEQWPPKFWKFQFTTDGSPSVDVAFTDARRFGRVRLVDCPGDDIRKYSPLKENGPDPVVDPDVFTEDYLRGKMRARHVPIKALLLDQAMISGIGNWVADETLYQAKLHPEQYCDDFDDAQVTMLYKSIRYVCQLAVDKLGDSDQFPEDWLFKHRWGKGAVGKGTSAKLPTGERLAFITVGGRTSCYAPGIQKKTGGTVPGIKEDPIEEKEDVEAPKKKVKKLKKEGIEAAEKDVKTSKKGRKASSKYFNDDATPPPKKRSKAAKTEPEGDVAKTEDTPEISMEGAGRRRSTRLRK